jgi:hypothetical protein
MKCPVCGNEVRFGDPAMPFCSERCKLLDLGDWAAEKHIISTPIPHTPEAEMEPDEQ